MPTASRVFAAEAFEAGTKYPTARIVDPLTGTVQTQSNFSGLVQRRVYDLGSSDPSTAVLSNTVAVSAVMFNSLQSWDIDDVGYNFQDDITSNDVAWEGNHTYRLSYLLPHTTHGYIPVVFDLKILQLFSL